MKLDKKDYKLLYSLFAMKENTLLHSMYKVCKKYYDADKIHATNKYIYVEGTIPIALVAHLDTVHYLPVTKMYHDEKENVLWSPQGLGADDRAGVFSILKLLIDGFRPTIIFTTGEEVGGIGANNLVADYPKPLSEIKYMIELDRNGEKDAVYYSCDNGKFEEYVSSFDFVTDIGSFSDISIIAPVWGVAAVNLSIGYKNEHTYGEHLNYNDMFNTINKVKKMLDDADFTEPYEYIKELSIYTYEDWTNKYMRPGQEMCNGCGKMFNPAQLSSIKYENSYFHFCEDCRHDWIKTCEVCGSEYLHMRTDEHDVCDECMKEIFG